MATAQPGSMVQRLVDAPVRDNSLSNLFVTPRCSTASLRARFRILRASSFGDLCDPKASISPRISINPNVLIACQSSPFEARRGSRPKGSTATSEHTQIDNR